MFSLKQSRGSVLFRGIASLILFTFSFTSVITPSYAQVLPLPTATVYNPTIIQGFTLHPENPLAFDFIVDSGDMNLIGEPLTKEANKQIKYFFAALTLPEKNLWVNLSPYEKDRIISEDLSATDLGRDMLAQDYLLKQLTASLLNPENELGEKFWARIYKKTQERFGSTDIPTNTFNKIWIVPKRALIYTHDQSVFVAESYLQVMLEEDYLAQRKALGEENFGTGKADSEDVESLTKMHAEILREVLIPEIENEVNHGETFSTLRQIFNAMILAKWYKENLRQTLLAKAYVNQGKTSGIERPTNGKDEIEDIYNQYVKAFRQGAYDQIKEDYDPVTQEIIPRKYFTGGIMPTTDLAMLELNQQGITGAQAKQLIGSNRAHNRFTVNLKNPAMLSVELELKEKVPGIHDVRPEELFLRKYDKVLPLTLNFFQLYGGDKEEYASVRQLEELLRKSNVLVVDSTTDSYADVEKPGADGKATIKINSEFLDFMFKTGRKKILISFIAGLLLEAHSTKSSKQTKQDILTIQRLLTGKKESLFASSRSFQSRLDDTKALYELKKKVERNDTPEGAEKPYFLTKEDIFLVLGDYMQRGKIMSKLKLRKYLRAQFGYYGDKTEEEAEKLLEEFYALHKGIMERNQTPVKDDFEDLANKLDPSVKQKLLAKQSQMGKEDNKGKINVSYGFKTEFMRDPAFKDRITVWDIEVERQDEIDFGGKTAHTGEMMGIPGIVTLANFASSGKTFQRLFNNNSFDKYLPFVQGRISALEAYIETVDENLMAANLTDKQKGEISRLRIVIDEKSQDSVKKQLKRNLEIMRALVVDLQKGSYQNLKDYFTKQGSQLDAKMLGIRTQRDALAERKKALDIQLSTEKVDSVKAQIQSEIDAITKQDADLFRDKTRFMIDVTDKLLIAARLMLIDDGIQGEFKNKLRDLAKRLDIPLEKLVLAIRSSAIGEDSETASFAGRQDTKIFVRPLQSTDDPEGLDNVILEWLFNQASLFNKRAVDYRIDNKLPTFDEEVEISTLFQSMFLSKYSYITFSVDRKSGYPAVGSSITEGQGESLVSGDETGSAYIYTYDGVLLDRQRGDRKNAWVETSDRLGKVKVEIPVRQRNEYAITDEEMLAESTEYVMAIHDYYEGYVDLEGAYREKEDEKGQPIVLRDEAGNVLRDKRGFPRYDWTIVSTQARPETVWSSRDQDTVPLKQIVVSDEAYEKASREGRVLSISFLAKINGTAQGPVTYVHDKSADELAKASNRIMITEQSDPDMNDAMKEARGIIAMRGGQNSHTMIVADEFGLVAVTGIPEISSLEELEAILPEGTLVTIDAQRGKIILGIVEDVAVEGKDIDVSKLRNPPLGGTRPATITASKTKAFKEAPLARFPGHKGIGLLRLELALAEIGVYPEALLAYDNMIKKQKGEFVNSDEPIYDPRYTDVTEEDIEAYNRLVLKEKSKMYKKGRMLDRKQDAELIKKIEHNLLLDKIENKILGYNSGEDFYKSILAEWITAVAETVNAPQEEVVIRAQSLKDSKLRLKVLSIVKDYYKQGLGQRKPLMELKYLFEQESKKAQYTSASHDAETLLEIVWLLDKTVKIRLDDRKSDEYETVIGATGFIKVERNAMKGLRGLDLLLATPHTFKWQLQAIASVAKKRRAKMEVFAPVVRTPESVRQLLQMMDQEGLTQDVVYRGIMTEIPTNALDITDFLNTGIDFVSNGGNDGEQTITRTDRNASDDLLKGNTNIYMPGFLRWNAAIATGVHTQKNKIGTDGIHCDSCGNQSSVPGQQDFGAGLGRMGETGYRSISVTVGAYEKHANNLASDVPLRQAVRENLNFKIESDPNAMDQIEKLDYVPFSLSDFRLSLGFHYKALFDYDNRLKKMLKDGTLSADLIEQKKKVDAEVAELQTGDSVLAFEEAKKRQSQIHQNLELFLLAQKIEKLLKEAHYENRTAMQYYQDTLQASIKKAAEAAKAQGKQLFIATDNVFSNVYREQDGGHFYEPQEANPDLGVHGLVKVLNHDSTFFDKELNVLLGLSEVYSNLVLQLRAVRTHEDISSVNKLLRQKGVTNVKLAFDIEVPSNIFEIPEILEAENNISYITLSDPRRLTSDQMTKEQDNINGILITPKDVQSKMRRPLVHIANNTKKKKVPFLVHPSLLKGGESEVTRAMIEQLPENQTNGNKKLEEGKKDEGDNAQLGGIDFNPAAYQLEQKGNTSIQVPVFDGPVDQLNINGFVPIIINVVPIIDMPMLLGFEPNTEEPSSTISQELDPADRMRTQTLDAEDLQKISMVNN